MHRRTGGEKKRVEIVNQETLDNQLKLVSMISSLGPAPTAIRVSVIEPFSTQAVLPIVNQGKIDQSIVDETEIIVPSVFGQLTRTKNVSLIRTEQSIMFDVVTLTRAVSVEQTIVATTKYGDAAPLDEDNHDEDEGPEPSNDY